MENKLSVIVPVYNAERHLGRCVDSILSQSFSDFELILVDDGSSDTSYEMCLAYSQSDSRVRAIHKENGGANSARQGGGRALKRAVGDFCRLRRHRASGSLREPNGQV